MAVTEKPTVTDAQRRQLKTFFEDTQPMSRLLASLRSRRVGRGYSIESGKEEYRTSTGRSIRQEEGPLAFVSDKEFVPLSTLEEAVMAWSACGPNGMVHWDIAVHGGFHELVWLGGRTSPSPGNSSTSDLLIISDDGVSIYKPGQDREKMVEIQGEEDYDKILQWHAQYTTKVNDKRPDVDWATRVPGAPNASLFGPYQYNLNRDGQHWLIPITDHGWLHFSVLLNIFDAWHLYMVDDETGEPAGVGEWVGEGKLEFPVTISQWEQFIFLVESYVPGCMVQNMRLAAEAMGLGAWIFCGYFDDVLMGAFPDVARGLEFRHEALNPKAPLGCGALKTFGVEGVKEGTYVPSPRFANGEAVMNHVYEEKYAPGMTMHKGEDNWMLNHKGPFNERTAREIIEHPGIVVSDWAREACIAYVDYCVDKFGQSPVYFNPLQCNFGAVIHHLDESFYERFYDGSSVTPQIREHMARWH
ncbi:MAG: hypothetical protein ACRDY7_02110 [Acidimicrobiia bacterium]